MPCNICHEEYRGLSADCGCTMYGASDESELSPEELRGYRRAQRIRRWRKFLAPKFVRMSEQGRPVYRFGWHYLLWKHRRGLGYVVFGLALCLIITSTSGCAGGLQQVNDAFELPMAEYAKKWEGGLAHWTMEDIHVDVNRVVADKYYNPKRPQLNCYCWETAEMKHDMAVEKGIDPADMEVIVFLLDDDTAIARKVESGSTHAVLRVGDTIYDNGFIAKTPFDVEELTRYGTIVLNTWSEEKYL
jgi:hypothetical protein